MKFQKGKIVNVAQGSPEWAALRAKRFTASEAPAMMGKSKYQSRSDLLKQKATGLVPDVDEHQQRIFDKGHKAEAAARPIAEKFIDDDLFPVVLDDEEGGFLASMDGLTMMGDIGWEHKLINESLASQIDAGQLDEHYMIQLDQQFALSGAEKILFTASDGTEENCKHLWVERDESRFGPVEKGWTQFAKDLSEYKPADDKAPKADGKTPDTLPALSVQVQGMVTASNLKEFEESAQKTLAGIKTDLETDQDFADAEKAMKFCKEVEAKLSAAKDGVLGQMQSVDEVVRTFDRINEEFRQKRLKLEKDVKAKKEQRKAEILRKAQEALTEFVRGIEEGINSDVVDVRMPTINADFAGAMRGKKTLSSLQSACDDELARAKIEANEVAEVLFDNLQQLTEHAGDYLFLFNDAQQIITKPVEDFAAIVKARIADYQKAQAEREQQAQQDAAATPETVADPTPEQPQQDLMPSWPKGQPSTLGEYEQGYIDGLTEYAHWKDGVQYVGTCGRTLEQAINEFLKQRKAA